jgi:hypothetical protein
MCCPTPVRAAGAGARARAGRRPSAKRQSAACEAAYSTGRTAAAGAARWAAELGWCERARLRRRRPARAGSRAVADLALRVRPRYHFAGGLGAHFARPPYLNKDRGAGGRPRPPRPGRVLCGAELLGGHDSHARLV